MRITTLTSRRTAVAAVATASLAAASAGLILAPMAQAATATMTLSATSGPSVGGNGLTVTTAANVFATGAKIVLLYKSTTTTTCSAAYPASLSVPTAPSGSTPGTAVIAVTPKVLTAKKLAFIIPTATSPTMLVPAATGATSAAYLVCAYPGTNTTTSLLAATGAYTVAAAPTLASSSAILPASGPALGGGTVTIAGTGFTSNTTAKIGTLSLTDVVVASSGTSLTGVVPAQAAATGLSISVTNVGGTATKATAYSYTNGITISPNTAPTATAATDVDVQGVGFATLDWSKTNGADANYNAATAHVYLVDGNYDPLSNSGAKTKAQLGECLDVLVISDTELICTLNTVDSNGSTGTGTVAITDGTYTLTVVNDGAVGAQLASTYTEQGGRDLMVRSALLHVTKNVAESELRATVRLIATIG